MEEENKNTLAESGEETTAAPVEETKPTETAGENDTTVELRENYEEVVAEGEKAKKPKKKMGKGKLSLIIVGSVLAAIILAIVLFFAITQWMNKPIPNPQLDTHPTRPAAETTISAELQNKIDHALTAEATDAEKAEAAMELYALANQNKINSDKCVMVAAGEGSADVTIPLIGKAVGSMAVRAIKVQDNGTYYYQKGAKVIDTNKLDVETLSVALDKQERAYCSADHNTCRTVIKSGSEARAAVGKAVDEVFYDQLPFIDLDVKDSDGDVYPEYEEEYTYETFKESAFIYSNPLEINNFNYRKEAIHDVEFKTDVDNGQTFYEIVFIVDVTDKLTVDVAREYLRETSGAPDLEFTELVVTLRIWDNGYIRSFSDTEKWAGNAKIGPIDGKSSSDTSYEASFYWDYESLVADGILLEDDPDIHKDTYTADIIKKYASQPGWVSAK